MLPKEAIEEFKKIHRNVFGEEISESDATRRAHKFMDFYNAVLDEPPSTFVEDTIKYEQRRENN